MALCWSWLSWIRGLSSEHEAETQPGWDANPGTTLSLSLLFTPRANRAANQLTDMFLCIARKPESLEEAHMDTGRMCNTLYRHESKLSHYLLMSIYFSPCCSVIPIQHNGACILNILYVYYILKS